MFKELKKLIRDTTQIAGHYVAKDVRNWIAFGFGVLLCVMSAVRSDRIHNVLALQAGGVLLAYSLGAAVKSYYQYKNNTVASEAVCADGAAVVEDDEPTPTGKPVE